METLSEDKCTTFFELIKCTPGLDTRSNQGKKHCLAVVILGVIIALYRYRDGNLSSIHRALTNTHADLCKALCMTYTPSVSRAQLPIILKKRILPFFQICIFLSLE
jgi:hypothetical protein